MVQKLKSLSHKVIPICFMVIRSHNTMITNQHQKAGKTWLFIQSVVLVAVHVAASIPSLHSTHPRETSSIANMPHPRASFVMAERGLKTGQWWVYRDSDWLTKEPRSLKVQRSRWIYEDGQREQENETIFTTEREEWIRMKKEKRQSPKKREADRFIQQPFSETNSNRPHYANQVFVRSFHRYHGGRKRGAELIESIR